MLNSMEGKTSYFIHLLVTSCWIPWKAWRCIVRSNIWWCRIGRQCHRDQADQTRWCHASSSKWRCGLYLDVFLFLYSMFRFQDLSIGQCSQWSVVGCLFRGLKQSLPMETLVLSSKFWLLPSNCTFSSSTCMIVCHSKKILLKLAVCIMCMFSCDNVVYITYILIRYLHRT